MGQISASIGLAILLSGGATSQTVATAPAFEVADVHVRPPGSTPFTNIGVVGPRYEVRTAAMLDLIGTAYGMDSAAVVGGPAAA